MFSVLHCLDALVQHFKQSPPVLHICAIELADDVDITVAIINMLRIETITLVFILVNFSK